MLSRALDVGCSVGRATFELSKTYDEVLGIDFSRAFVSKCQQLKVTGQTSYFLVSEGLLGEEKTANIDPAISIIKKQGVGMEKQQKQKLISVLHSTTVSLFAVQWNAGMGNTDILHPNSCFLLFFHLYI